MYSSLNFNFQKRGGGIRGLSREAPSGRTDGRKHNNMVAPYGCMEEGDAHSILDFFKNAYKFQPMVYFYVEFHERGML